MKHSLKVILAGVVLGIALLVLTNVLHIDERVFLSVYWKLGLALILLVAIMNTGYYFYKLRQLKPVMALYEGGDYKKFVDELENLISGTRNKYLQNIMKLNLGAGYLDLNQPAKLVDVYESMDVNYLKNKNLKLVYRLNLAIAYFKLEDLPSFDRIFKANEAFFASFEEHATYGESVGQLYLMEEISEGHFNRPRERLTTLRGNSRKPKMMNTYNQLEDILNEKAARFRKDAN
ncbi:hypothetical protein [Peptoniphilus sp. EMRHCC_23]|uniref:hypothetical protein n=1 Tax=Peptoniphilus rachelemmaiella TaxID=2811779 RepID=UPI001C0068D6|nr:hypothetical protein [Peptoniphilus rachelemmaiella]